MDKKKLLKLIDQLQPQSEEPIIESVESDERQIVVNDSISVQSATDNESNTIDFLPYPNDYFKITSVNGEPFDDETRRISLSYGDYFTVSLNSVSLGLCYLRFAGLTRMAHYNFSLCTLDDELICECDSVGQNFYDIQFGLYRLNIPKEFKFVALWRGVETISLNKVRIIEGLSPTYISDLSLWRGYIKNQYFVGDLFDATGMNLIATCFSGDQFIITDFTYSPTGPLKVTDEYITVDYMGKYGTIPITVLEKTPISIKITKQPTKLTYLSGEIFDPKGMVVVGVYRDDIELTINDYTYTKKALTISDHTVTISYQGKSTELTLDVNGQKLTLTGQLQTRQANTQWQNAGVTSNISFSYVNGTETSTVIKIPTNTIDFGNLKKANVKMKLTAVSDKTRAVQFYVNDKPCSKQAGVDSVLIDLGVINSADDYAEYRFSYKDNNYSFALSGADSPVIYLSRMASVGDQSTVKEFSLIGGATVGVDVCNGEARFIINDIASSKALLGYGISHVRSEKSSFSCYGNKYQLNLCETLFCKNDANGNVISYEYTDAAGKAFYVERSLFYLKNGVKYYLSESDMDKISKDNLTFEGNVLYSELKPVYNQYLLTEPNDVIKNSQYYNSTSPKPIAWLRCGSLTKGFDANGRLVMVSDEFGNYFTVTYFLNGSINTVTDCNGSKITFSYTDGLLTKITDTRGRAITYTYLQESDFISSSLFVKGTLSSISGPDDRKLAIGYELSLDTPIKSLTDSDGYKINFAYKNTTPNYGGVKSIITYSCLSKVPDGTAATSEISRVEFDLSNSGKTILTDSDGNRDIYEFDDNSQITAYYKETAGVVSQAERYTYTPFVSKTTQKAVASSLNKTAYEAFNFVADEKCSISLDVFNRPVKSVTSNVRFTSNAYKNVTTDYGYENNGNLKYEKTQEEHYLNNLKTYQVNIYNVYSYTAAGVLAKKISHVTTFSLTQGTEYQEDAQCEEYVYDAKGNLTKTLHYTHKAPALGCQNTCSCTSKNAEIYYEEYGYDAARRVISAKDITGKYTMTYGYKTGTELISTVTPPAGSSFGYTYDESDRVTKYYTTTSGTENNVTTEYSVDKVGKLTQNGATNIKYAYDGKRRLSTVYLDGAEYESYVYADNVTENGKKADRVTRTNANGESFKAVAYKDGTGAKLYYNNTLIADYAYNKSNKTQTVTDKLGNDTQTTVYDDYGNLLTYKDSNSTETYSETVSYGACGRVTKVNSSGTVARTVSYGYNEESVSGKVIKQTVSPFEMEYKYDAAGRLVETTTKINGTTIDKEVTEYYKEGDHATKLPKSKKFYKDTTLDKEYTYEYDSRGNISKYRGNAVHEYKYDELNRLSRESVYSQSMNYDYSYDANGNILYRHETLINYNEDIDNMIGYRYEGNRLASSCEYDDMGNPTLYRGKAATWGYGRRMLSFGTNTFKYDALGRRIEKNGIKFYYDSQGRLIKQSNGVEFFYDIRGVLGYKYNGNYYYYRKNAQGDILAILNSDGELVNQYDYDAWGKKIFIYRFDDEITKMNPFGYHGYYLDSETGLYFLQSRYYDPEVGRFLNMDSIDYADPETICGLNLYAYCNNNPVMYTDPNGTWSWDTFFETIAWIGVGVTAIAAGLCLGGTISIIALGAALGGLVGGYANMENGGSFIMGWIGGAINGGIQSTGTWLFGGAGTVIGGGVGAFLGNFATQGLNSLQQGKKFNVSAVLDSSVKSGISSVITSIFTACVQFLADNSVNELVGGSILDKIPGSVFTQGFANLFSAFFGAIDDFFSYKISPNIKW